MNFARLDKLTLSRDSKTRLPVSGAAILGASVFSWYCTAVKVLVYYGSTVSIVRAARWG